MFLVFDTCEVRSCADVAIVNDNWPEDAEYFVVSLEMSSAHDEWLSIDVAEAVVEIHPNDGEENSTNITCCNII